MKSIKGSKVTFWTNCAFPLTCKFIIKLLKFLCGIFRYFREKYSLKHLQRTFSELTGSGRLEVFWKKKKDKIRWANPWSSPFLGKFLSAQIISRYKQGRSLYDVFRTVLSFSCFSPEFLLHINENVSFHHVAFLHLIRYGNVHGKSLN